MNWKSAVIMALLAQSSLAAAQDQDAIPIAPAPDWAIPSEPLSVPDDIQGPVFMRRQNSFIHLSATGHEYFNSQMIRVLQPQALEIGNIAIAWNPAAGGARVHKVAIHRNGQEIDVLSKTAFEILRREDQLEAAMLDGMLTAVMRVPDLRVGDDLELEYTVPMNDPTLREASHGLLFIGAAPPPGRYRIDLSWDDGQKPGTLITPDLASFVQTEPRRIAISIDNPSTINLPRDAPPRYAWTRVVEFSDFADWQSLSRRFHGLFAEASQLAANSPLRAEAAAIAAANPDKLAQAQAALELVQQQVRYVYVGLNGGNFTPVAADMTWDRRYGDCKGKTAMLLALLGELGIPAEAVLVNNTDLLDGLDQRLANPGMFDHVLVRAKISGKSYWLDGTLPNVVEGRTDPFMPYQWVLPLSAKGNTIERLPQKPFALPQVMELYEIDASAGFDVPAQWKRTTVTRGVAGLQQHLQFSSVSAGQLENAFKSQLSGSSTWDEVESVSYRFDRVTQAAILTIIGIGPVDWENIDKGGRYFRLPGGGFNPPARRLRGAESGSEVPFYQSFDYNCHVTTLRLPDDTDVADWGFNSVFDKVLYGEAYYRMMELRKTDRTFRLIRGNRVEQTEINAAKAERDNGRLADFDNSMAILTYSPGNIGEPWGDLRKVPATFEIDWSAEDPPCLPADMLSSAE